MEKGLKMKWGIRTIVKITTLILLLSACDAQISNSPSRKIDVSATGNMTIVRNGFDPDKTLEALIETTPSIDIEDERQILAIINGKEYISGDPACILSDTELEELLTICDVS